MTEIHAWSTGQRGWHYRRMQAVSQREGAQGFRKLLGRVWGWRHGIGDGPTASSRQSRGTARHILLYDTMAESQGLEGSRGWTKGDGDR